MRCGGGGFPIVPETSKLRGEKITEIERQSSPYRFLLRSMEVVSLPAFLNAHSQSMC